MPSFCRHNHLTQNCPICSKEQGIQMRPLVSSAAPASTEPRERSSTLGTPREPKATKAAGSRRSNNVKVRQLVRGADDGYRSPLVPGLKSSEDADRLARELAFAAQRLTVLKADPPGLWAEVAADGDIEERTWLAFLIAYIGPSDTADPFEAITAARVSWSSESDPAFDPELQGGPRGAYDPAKVSDTIAAYRAWVERAGSQHEAFTGQESWTPERRFERLFERLALGGLQRDVRFDLLVSLGYLGVYPLRAGLLQLSGENETTWAAKRAFGIGDPLLLERRASELATLSQAPLDALDLALHNWGSGNRIGDGIDPETDGDPTVLEATRNALGL